MSNRQRFLTEFPRAILDDTAALFVGAGISVGAGYPDWAKLLHEIGVDLGVRSTDVHDLAALAQWSVTKSKRTRILQVIKEQIGVEKPIPEVVRIVARLPIRSIWTTNYDVLIERAFREINRPIDAIAAVKDLALRPVPGAVRLYKMHGSVERPHDVVISTDDYELYRRTRGAFLPLLQAHLTSSSMLFLGLSFTDPNVKHVLALIRESFHDTPPEHFAIVRPPQREEFDTETEYKARLAQHDHWATDLLRYGLQVVEIDSYAEVPELMRAIERAVARQRIWISGSWAPGENGSQFVAEVAAAVGKRLAREGLSLVTGVGLTVGPASIGGFLDGLRESGAWDLERRLIARPFPQALAGATPNREHWTALRAEMARLAGAVVVLGGLKAGGQRAEGVFSERDAALAAGAAIVPVGATGGAASEIAKALRGSNISHEGNAAQRPSDTELRDLEQAESPDALAAKIVTVLKRVLGR